MLTPQFILDLQNELTVDNFAGGGGASTGIEQALGYPVHQARNHNRNALGMHRINHPQTVHHCEDVFEADPRTVCEGRPVGYGWFSPDCTHFSKAKGGKPVSARIRGLCLVMLRWAKYRTRVMTMENVEEIKGWGPLKRMKKKGKWGLYPDPEHKGRTWQAFLACMSTGIAANHPDLPFIQEVLGDTVTKAELVRGFGYRYDMREIRACDYGAPTIRKRLFCVFRCDGRPIIFPEATHGAPGSEGVRSGRLKPYRTIAQCIDFNLYCPSIFLTAAAAKAQGLKVKRPLADATLRRIAKGLERYVLKAKRPFLVSLTHQGGDRVSGVDTPANTITGAHRGETSLVVPSVTKFHGNHEGRRDGDTRGQSLDDPLLTPDTSNRFALTEATLAPFVTEHANASNQRNLPVDEPSRTICADVKGGHFALVSASVMVNTSSHPGAPASSPCPTIATGGHQALVTGTLAPLVVNSANSQTTGRGPNVWPPDDPLRTVTSAPSFNLVGATLVQTGYGERDGQEPRALDPDKPLGTIVAGGGKAGLVSATLVHTAHGEQDKAGNPRRGRGAHDLTESMPSVCGSPDMAVATATMVNLHGTSTAADIEEPMHTASAGGQHHVLVSASIIRHFGESVGQECDAPAPTVVAGGQGKTGLITAVMAQNNSGFNTTDARPVTDPLSTVSATGSQQTLVAASLAAYYGTEKDGQGADEPARTVTAKARQCLVESTACSYLTPEQHAGALRVVEFLRAHGVVIEGDFAMVAGHVIVDIGMRMLTPRELFRAQGFPEDYVIDRAWHISPKNGSLEEVTLTKEQQIKMCGNSVCPDVAREITLANVPELCHRRPTSPPAAPKKTTGKRAATAVPQQQEPALF